MKNTQVVLIRLRADRSIDFPSTRPLVVATSQSNDDDDDDNGTNANRSKLFCRLLTLLLYFLVCLSGLSLRWMNAEEKKKRKKNDDDEKHQKRKPTDKASPTLDLHWSNHWIPRQIEKRPSLFDLIIEIPAHSIQQVLKCLVIQWKTLQQEVFLLTSLIVRFLLTP